MDGRVSGVRPPFGARAWALTKATLGFILSQWLLIGMGVVCVLAYYFPRKNVHLQHALGLPLTQLQMSPLTGALSGLNIASCMALWP